MINEAINWLLNRPVELPHTPECPDHKLPLLLRGSIGHPARFDGQSEETYTQIYYCGVPGCNQTAAVKRHKSQAPVPAEVPGRPVYSRRDDLA